MNLRENVCILYAFSIIVCISALNSHVYKLCKMPMKNVLLNSRELNFMFISCMATMCIFDQNMNKRRQISLHIYIKVIITDVKSTIFFFVNVRVLYWTRNVFFPYGHWSIRASFFFYGNHFVCASSVTQLIFLIWWYLPLILLSYVFYSRFEDTSCFPWRRVRGAFKKSGLVCMSH